MHLPADKYVNIVILPRRLGERVAFMYEPSDGAFHRFGESVRLKIYVPSILRTGVLEFHRQDDRLIAITSCPGNSRQTPRDEYLRACPPGLGASILPPGSAHRRPRGILPIRRSSQKCYPSWSTPTPGQCPNPIARSVDFLDEADRFQPRLRSVVV